MKNKENRLVPKLRFPEFVDEWEIKKLSEILFEHKSKSTGKEEVFSVSVHKGLINQIEHLGRSFAASNTSNYKLVLSGDIIYTKSPTGNFPLGIIKQSKLNKSVIVSPLYAVFTPETKGLGYILDSYFESPENVYNYLSSIVQKGAKNTINITNDTFLSKSLLVPTNKAEQQKIADLLSSADQLIAEQSKKLDTLKDHKKGLMQQLFPAEGETVPKLRFSEFKDTGEWEVKMLGEIVYYENGKAHENEITENGIYIVVNSKFISTDGEVKKYTNNVLCIADIGDILMVLSDVPNGKAIAKCFLVNESNKYTVNQRVCKLRSKKDVKIFLYYVINRNPYFLAFDDGVKQTNLRKEDVFDCLLMLPRDIQEQQKIANCLSSLDELIAEHSKKLTALQLHKRGLMQQIFPNYEQ